MRVVAVIDVLCVEITQAPLDNGDFVAEIPVECDMGYACRLAVVSCDGACAGHMPVLRRAQRCACAVLCIVRKTPSESAGSADVRIGRTQMKGELVEEPQGFITIEGCAEGSYEEKRSRFLARIDHVETEEAALSCIARARQVHPQARHHVFAYRLRTGARVRASDDGEPQKTAGLPVLGVLEHAQLLDAVCVVVRYFGGTLLGTGGLVRAYTNAATAALDAAHLVCMAPCREFKIRIGYPFYERVSRILAAAGARDVTARFEEVVMLDAFVPLGAVDAAQRDIAEACQGQALVELAADGLASTPL